MTTVKPLPEDLQSKIQEKGTTEAGKGNEGKSSRRNRNSVVQLFIQNNFRQSKASYKGVIMTLRWDLKTTEK